MPPILLTREEPDTRIRCELRVTQGFWAVLYDGQTFNEVRLWPDSRSQRYERAVFGTPGRAQHAARKLNAVYETDKFTVHQMMVSSAALDDPRTKL